MITYIQGDLLQSSCQAVVNTVNCVGVMGKGIALQFKMTYPLMFKEYSSACRRGEVVPGKMHVWSRYPWHDSVLISSLDSVDMTQSYVINFPTKRHWREGSRLEDIESGLLDLVTTVFQLDVVSVAIPALGCANGGLDYVIIKPMIERAVQPLSDFGIDVHLYGTYPGRL